MWIGRPAHDLKCDVLSYDLKCDVSRHCGQVKAELCETPITKDKWSLGTSLSVLTTNLGADEWNERNGMKCMAWDKNGRILE